MDVPESVDSIPGENIRRFARDALLAAGVTEFVAETTARGLWTASIRGVDSHGIRLLPHYLAELERGRLNPEPDFAFEQTAPAIGLLDADDTFGIAAGAKAMEHAMAIAESSGAGHVVVRNSSHCGSLAYFGLKAAKDGLLGFASTHGSANTRTYGGIRPFFGNNPICVAAPMREEEPFCFDSAVTSVTFNEVKQHRERNEQLPAGVAANDDGVETRDPHEVTQLLPIGDYEGFGLAMVGDITNGLLSGMPVGRDVSSMFGDPLSEPRRLGHYFSATRIDAFVDLDEFKARLQELAEDVRSEPRADADVSVQVPGDPEKATKREREQVGIPVPHNDIERLEEIAEEFDLDSVADY